MDEQPQVESIRRLPPDIDLRAELGTPSDLDIRFQGEPILAINPTTNNLTPPARYLGHPLVRGRYFYTLPRALWDEVYLKIGDSAFDQELVELEYTLSELSGDHASRVGFWKGQPINYGLLRRLPMLSMTAELLQSLNWDINLPQFQASMQEIEARVNPMIRVARAYTGWLLTYRQFLDEHDALLEKWRPMVERWGLSYLGIQLSSDQSLPGTDPTADPSWASYTADFEAFFVRWRLQGLAGPYLPVPLQPSMAGSYPASVAPQMARGRGVFSLPDIFPVPSRDSLRNMLDDALHRSNPAEHLKEWRTMIARDNAAKKSLGKFVLLLELQHYWRIVHSRHGRALRKKTGVLMKILAYFLEAKPSTVHRHLIFIRKRLGKDWVERGKAYSVGPF